MKRSVCFGFICFCLGIAVMLVTQKLFAAPETKGIFVRIPDMEWKGQESHGPKTALKWVLGRQSDVDMESMTSFWMTKIGPGGVNKPHQHRNEEQLYYVLQGEGRMVIGDREFPAKAGDVGYFPTGVKHGFYNDGDEPAILIGVAARTNPQKKE